MSNPIARVFREGWRRKAVQSAATYAVAAWVFVEVSSVALDAFGAPDIILQSIIIVAFLGFPVTLVVSWIFDLTTEGIVRTEADAQGNEEEERAPETAAGPRLASQRLQLTILFCTVELAENEDVDPEDLLDFEPRAELLFNKICERFGGHIIPGRSGEHTAYFGYPIASEDAARNAVRAALGLADSVRRLDDQGDAQTSAGFSYRAAVHSGDVIVEHSGGTPAVVGMAPRETARLIERCQPEDVLVSEAAHKLVRGYFQFQQLEDGRDAAYKVLFESGARGRVEAEGEPQPLIGRELELSQLHQHWRRASEGQGQVVLLSGSAGIGKSRLVYEVKTKVAHDPKSWLIEFQSDPIHQSTALFPVSQFYRNQILGLSGAGNTREDLAKVEGFLAEYNQELQESVPIVADFLNIELWDGYAPRGLSPQKQREETLDLIVDVITQRAKRQPVLLILENLHWVDPTSLELMGRLIEQAQSLSMMVLITIRTPFELPWSMSSHIHQMTLAGLESGAVEGVCRSISPSLPDDVITQIAARADGVPLFVEEVTRALLESGVFDSGLSAEELEQAVGKLIPTTLKDALAARLDGLGTARATAQLGATLGRDFSHQLITEVAEEVDSHEVELKLQELIQPEIIHKVGAGRNLSYRFKHALIQDAAYQSMVKKQRHTFHKAISDVLLHKFDHVVQSHPAILAHHFEGAENPESAIEYLLKAADRAMLGAASSEAIAHLKKGLLLAEQLPIGERRTLLELALQTTLGTASMIAFGYASEQAHVAYMRANELCDVSIPLPHAVPVIMGLSAYHSVRGAVLEGQEQNEKILQIAKQTGDEELLLWGNAFISVGHFYLGNFDLSRQHMREVTSLYDLEKHRGLSIATSQDPKIFTLAHATHSLWAQGFPEQARKLAKEKDLLAKKIAHPLVMQQALGWGNVVHLYRDEPDILIRKAHRAHDIAEQQSMPFYVGGNLIWWGAGLSQKGDHQSGIEMMRQGLAMLASTGATIGKPMMLTLVAQSLGALDKPEQGLAEIETAIAQVDMWGERFFLAETLRVRADLNVQLGNTVIAEQYYREALATAVSQHAKSFELRASTSLADFLIAQNRSEEVSGDLKACYDWFSEGLNTTDLKKALTTLKQLGR